MESSVFPLSIDTAEVLPPTLNIDSGIAPSQPPSEEVAQTRAYKTHMGLGDVLDMDVKSIYRSIADGQEQHLRENAAMNITARAYQDREKAIRELAATKGSALTLQDVQRLEATPANPKSVVEQAYSRAYVNTLKDADARLGDTVLTDAQAENPAKVQEYFNKASDVLSKREYAGTAEQNAKAEVERHAWFSFEDPRGASDERFAGKINIDSHTLKSLFPFYDSYMLRGNTKETSRFGFLGNVLEAQANEIKQLPQADFEREFDRIYNGLMKSEPKLAQQWAHAVANFSDSDKIIYNVSEGVNVALTVAGIAGVRGTIRGSAEGQLKNLGDLSRGSDGKYRPGSTPPPIPPEGGGPGVAQITSDDLGRGAMSVQETLRQSPTPPTTAQAQAAKAVQDVLQSSSKSPITKSSIADGAGDAQEAAVQKVVKSFERPDPVQEGLDIVLSGWKASKNAALTYGGDLSRENYNRLNTAVNTYERNVVDVLTNNSPVVRTPALMEEGFRSIADKIKTYFPGRENTIGDINFRVQHLGSLTVHADVDILNYDATPFSSYELAANHARINGYPLSGIEGTAGERVYLPEAALLAIDYSGKKPKKVPTAFEVKRLPDGSFQFMNKDGVEILPSADPQPGLIPYNLTTNKFEKPLSEQTARIAQQGLGFRIVVSIPVNETENFIRDKLVINSTNKSLSNEDTSALSRAANAIIGYIRNPYDTLSKTENENRAKTVFGQSKFIDLVKQEISEVEDIYKGMLGDRNVVVEKAASYGRIATGANKVVADRFTRALVASQTMPDKAGLPGYYMQTPAEIQHFWMSNFNGPASFKEQSAYLAVGRLDHFDHILRNIAVHRYKTRAGVESWSFNTVKDGKSTSSGSFDARQVNEVHNGDDIVLIHDVDGSERYFHKMGTEKQREFRDALTQGKYTGVELWDPEKRPVKRYDEEGNLYRIRYIFGNVMDRKPLTFDQVGYRGGGHWQYDYSHGVKQAIVRPQRMGQTVQHIYEGDTTFGFVGNRAEGEYFAKHMNEVSRLIRARQYKDAKNYAKANFDIEWKKLYAGFRPGKNPTTGDIQPPRFSTDPRQAFRVVPEGRTILDLDKELEVNYSRRHPKTDVIMSTFVDGTRHGSLARNFQVAYTQERDSYDLNEFKNIGTVDKPFYEFRPAKLTDPITTLTRSMDRIVNSTYMDDMKITAVEHWLEENKDLLQATEREIRSSPFFYFNEGKYKNNPDNITRIAIADTNRYKIKQFIGTPSFTDTVIQGVKQTLLDGMYELGRDTAIAKLDNVIEKGGALSKPAKVVRAPLVMPEWLLQNTINPVDFLRGMTYHSYLGLFAVKQVFVQSMAYTSIYGLAGPVKATQGSIAAWLHQWSRINGKPNIVEALDRSAVNFGWKLGEFTEAMRIGDRTGFFEIRNEISLDNGLHKQTFFRNDAKGILDAGQVPFHEGNLHVRFGAWYTAFKEFRDHNPYMKVGPVQEGQILYRANYLNTLMTRDANTILNKGLIGIPFQFFDYMKKVADVFWSKNIGEDFGKMLVQGKDGTYREVSNNTVGKRSYVRARMYFLYAMLGGAFGSIGVTGLPFGESIRQRALEGTLPFQEEAYVPGDKVWTTAVMEGPTSTFIAYLTGFGDIKKGVFYNFNNRFNPNGLQQLREVIQTDPKLWDVLLGAMGTDVGNKLASMSGFVNAMYSMMEGDPAKEAWPLKLDDWLAPLKTVSSFSDADRAVYALAFGKWLDKRGRPTSDVGKIDTIFRTLTGLTDQRIDDQFLKTMTMKDRKAVYDKALREFEHQSYLAEQAASNGDKEQADDYNKRAFFALTSRNVPLELWPKAIARRGQMNIDTIEKNNNSYYRQYVPQNLQDKAREADRKIQQMKDK